MRRPLCYYTVESCDSRSKMELAFSHCWRRHHITHYNWLGVGARFRRNKSPNFTRRIILVVGDFNVSRGGKNASRIMRARIQQEVRVLEWRILEWHVLELF